ncbi:MAG: cupin domain-containing protein [Ancalomicrobiaceae bacterium]|nr:cupin domain-containing protein [Ancalomicrobiaceae bacterium]
MPTTAPATAEAIIAALQLSPHPEGGWYIQTFCDSQAVDGRAASTAIYFLLKENESSHWHRIDAVEVWHWYAGAKLELICADDEDDDEPETIILGNDILAGERPQAIVPHRAWQSARPLGGWVLVGCTVAPGFLYSRFELAPPGWRPGKG